MAEKQHLSNLTALRGIAAFLVVIFHTNAIVAPWVEDATTLFIEKLYLMVDLFFVLSGFVMCYVYQDGFAGGVTPKGFGAFIGARFARIYPLHLATIAALALSLAPYYLLGKERYMSGFVRSVYDFGHMPVQLLLLQAANVLDGYSWNVPSWSISAEWWAYMAFPFMILYVKKGNGARLAALAAAVLGGYLLLVYYLAPNATVPAFMKAAANLDVTWNYGCLRGLLGFALGVLVYQAFKAGALRNLLANGWMVLGVLVVWAALTHLGLSDVLVVALFPPVVLAAAYGSPGLNAFFSNRILQRLGDWSFSIYMWHLVVFSVAMTASDLAKPTPPAPGPPGGSFFGITSPPLIWLAYLAVTVGVGALSYEYLEKPSRMWLRQVLSPKKAKASEVF